MRTFWLIVVLISTCGCAKLHAFYTANVYSVGDLHSSSDDVAFIYPCSGNHLYTNDGARICAIDDEVVPTAVKYKLPAGYHEIVATYDEETGREIGYSEITVHHKVGSYIKIGFTLDKDKAYVFDGDLNNNEWEPVIYETDKLGSTIYPKAQISWRKLNKVSCVIGSVSRPLDYLDYIQVKKGSVAIKKVMDKIEATRSPYKSVADIPIEGTIGVGEKKVFNITTTSGKLYSIGDKKTLVHLLKIPAGEYKLHVIVIPNKGVDPSFLSDSIRFLISNFGEPHILMPTMVLLDENFDEIKKYEFKLLQHYALYGLFGSDGKSLVINTPIDINEKGARYLLVYTDPKDFWHAPVTSRGQECLTPTISPFGKYMIEIKN